MTYFGPTQVVTKRLTEEKLTPREREVALMAHKSNKEIAEALHLSIPFITPKSKPDVVEVGRSSYSGACSPEEEPSKGGS